MVSAKSSLLVPEILDRRFKGTHLPTPTNDRFLWTTSTQLPWAISVLLWRPRPSSWFSIFHICTYLKLVKPALNPFVSRRISSKYTAEFACTIALHFLSAICSTAYHIWERIALAYRICAKMCECVFKESLGLVEHVTANPSSISVFSYKSL